jgi:hypothetical protein
MKLKKLSFGEEMTNGNATLEAKKLRDALILYDSSHLDHPGISGINLGGDSRVFLNTGSALGGR